MDDTMLTTCSEQKQKKELVDEVVKESKKKGVLTKKKSNCMSAKERSKCKWGCQNSANTKCLLSG